MNCQEIMVLDHGQLVEFGQFHELKRYKEYKRDLEQEEDIPSPEKEHAKGDSREVREELEVAVPPTEV